MNNMFKNSMASSVDVSGFNTKYINNMGNMFSEFAATEIKGLDKFDTSKVTTISNMFASAHANYINVSSFNTSKVTNMSRLFNNNYATEIIGLENFNTSLVTNMSYMFRDSQATSLDLSSFNASNVTSMFQMFGSSNVKVLDLSTFDTSKVTNMYCMFYFAKNLKTIYTSSSFNTNNVTNSTNMFGLTLNLVGGAGTIWTSANPTDKTYARVDGGTSSPGYFTLKSN